MKLWKRTRQIVECLNKVSASESSNEPRRGNQTVAGGKPGVPGEPASPGWKCRALRPWLRIMIGSEPCKGDRDSSRHFRARRLRVIQPGAARPRGRLLLATFFRHFVAQ